MSDSLSPYELQRLQTIEANNKVLRALGLDKPLVAKKPPSKPARRTRKDDDPDFVPERRTTRASGHHAKQQKRTSYEEDSSEGDSDDDDDDDDEIPRPRKAPKKAVPAVPPPAVLKAVQSPPADQQQCITVEAAKTGRSKCRACMEVIAQGELRVGMESWMVGRQVTVWQHPACFWRGLAITAEPTGRGKCKATSAAFDKGELRLSAKAHITTAHVKLSCASDAVLARVRAADPAGCRLDNIEGIGELSAGERAKLEQPSSSSAAAAKEEVEETPSTTAAIQGDEHETGAAPAVDAAEERRQPPKGRSTKAKGKVCWTFAGHLCYGSLLPNQETAPHCYARTHKGNTKTLTKGGASWWMLD